MKTPLIAAACLALVALFPLPAAADGVEVYIAGPGISIGMSEPPPRWDGPAYVRPGRVWIPGRWAFDGYRYVWIAGAWAPVGPAYGYGPRPWERGREWGREWRDYGERHHHHYR